MTTMAITQRLNRGLNVARHADFLAPLLLRLFLAPVFITAGLTKLLAFESTVSWMGNPDWGLGLPLPWLMAVLATATELVGGWLLLFGLGTRLIAIPLMATMLVAAFAVHWHNGWFAIAPSDPSTSMARPLAAIGIPTAEQSLENSEAVGERLSAARQILREHGNYSWLTGKGNIVILNNGIEFAATYFIMLLSLFFTGGGRYCSADYWIGRRWLNNRD
ncbi:MULTISPECIES: HvfX family Cu-binding RiPP maturation protein [Porticoccus]|jgi:putative oxidoreductase|uniref:HvfX family Cu-binding RiPP maturation protein n=1 Tax=Porticoccus TaxID=1123967 RepID=UPI00056A4B1E|nr:MULTISPECIES: DoxX family protein [Porticoccus]|tara:strand:- start:8888 stop:9544 length:657 start_codon:yes stop_codon:yes gene_type:complete